MHINHIANNVASYRHRMAHTQAHTTRTLARARTAQDGGIARRAAAKKAIVSRNNSFQTQHAANRLGEGEPSAENPVRERARSLAEDDVYSVAHFTQSTEGARVSGAKEHHIR
eukprot:scaffold98301_cov36-Tisochrysis_lutea.AAC.1